MLNNGSPNKNLSQTFQIDRNRAHSQQPLQLVNKSGEFEQVPILIKGPTTALKEKRQKEPIKEKIPVTAIDFSARRINRAADVARSIELEENYQQ